MSYPSAGEEVPEDIEGCLGKYKRRGPSGNRRVILEIIR